jgi:hypothetical protein
MRVESFQPNWAVETSDRDSVTQLYVKPTPPAPVIRSYEVEDRFTLPTFARHSQQHPSQPYLGPAFVAPRPTQPVRRVPSTAMGIGFAGICVLVGIIIGSIFAFSGKTGAIAAPVVVAPKAIVAPPPATVTAIVPAPVAPPVRTTVRVASEPAGATAMLVDDGKTSHVGMTPVDAQLDPSRSYDLIIALDGYQTKVVHVDPSNAHVDVTLVPEVVAPVPVTPVAHHHHTPRPVVAPVVAAAPGTLQISSKPPCSIVIDGKATGLTTPQRSISLTPGSHDITLINAAEGIHLSAEVDVTSEHTTQLVRDFTN